MDLAHQLNRLSGLVKPVFVVILSGGLHVADFCLRFVPENIDCVVILNGLEPWEINWAMGHYKVKDFIQIPRQLNHGLVIDCLFDHIDQPFGILDYDCFVFQKDLFYQMREISPRTSLNAIFVCRNQQLNINIPETFFLFLNGPLFHYLRKKYKVGSPITSWDKLSPTVKKKFLKIGISPDCMPEEHKTYFDMLRVLVLLGIAEGYKTNFIYQLSTYSPPSPIIFHAGSIAAPFSRKDLYDLRGAYLWRRSLENHPDQELRKRYEDKFGTVLASTVLDDFPNSREVLGEEFLNCVDHITSKV